MGDFNKKFIVLVCAVLILFSVLPKPAFAVPVGVPTVEMNPVLVGKQTAFQGLTSVSTFKEVAQTFFEYVKKVAVETLKKQLLNMMVDQIVTWIQGGGNPKFITDWQGFFRDAVDQAGGKFIDNFALKYRVNLCSPFRPLLGAGFIPIPTFTTRTACTLTAIGVNLDAFLKDFKKGNWVAWQEMVLRPQNNIYGAYVLAWDQYEIEKSAAAKAAAAEAQAGKGFLSVKRCITYDNALLSDCMLHCFEEQESCITGCQKVSCTKWETITPGAVVGELAAQAVGSDLAWLVNAQDLAAYTAAITNALLNRMFAEGVGLLRVAITPSPSSPGGSGSSAQTQCAQLLGKAGYNDCITAIQGGEDIKEFQKNYLISLIDQDLDYQNQLLGAKQATLLVLNESIDVLNKLAKCKLELTPPDSSPVFLSQVQGAASTTASQIIQIQSDIIALQVKQQEIKAITELKQIASFWAQVSDLVNPSLTSSLAISAQQETGQKQQDLSTYQAQLDFCTQLKQQQLIEI